MSRVVGHYAPWLLIAVVAILVGLTVVPVLPPAIGWQLMAALLVVVLVLAVSVFSHNRRLCERCIAGIPLDASAVASRYSTRFRVAHFFERKLFAGCYLVFLLGASFLNAHPTGRYAWAVAQASLGYLLLVYATHQRLQPWCPYCKSGGEEQSVPTTPTPVSSVH